MAANSCIYRDVYKEVLGGRWLLKNLNFVVLPEIERDLNNHGFSMDFAIRHLKSVVYAFGIEVEFQRDLETPIVWPMWTYSHSRFGKRLDLAQVRESAEKEHMQADQKKICWKTMCGISRRGLNRRTGIPVSLRIFCLVSRMDVHYGCCEGSAYRKRVFTEAITGPVFRLWKKRPLPEQDAIGPETSPLRVLQIIFNPLIEDEGGRRLSEVVRWNDPDRLAAGYSADLAEASHGIARFEIVERVELDEWPLKQDGFRYDDQSFLRAWGNHGGFHQPDGVDYHAIIERFAILQRVAADQIDEVWLFGPPYSGLWESTMAGPGAFWCNSPPIVATGASGRRFVIMGFNYERGVDCMLENFGHRSESIMSRVYQGYRGERNRWEHFCRHEQVAPGQSSCGNVHFAPSSATDYDWGNPRMVWSDCDDWYNYPNLTGERRRVQCREWGGGDMRLHHLWWLDHLPRATGSDDGVLNNWWRYILDPNLVR